MASNSVVAISKWFSKRCHAGGVKNRTAHDIREAGDNIPAEADCSAYQIMLMHGHSESRMSENFTCGVERPDSARQAMEQ